jgi:outer membrane protein assembly factor BamB/protein-L-isoaspartate O-methyltransferase
MHHPRKRYAAGLVALAAGIALIAAGYGRAATSPRQEADRILEATGVEGGLVVHVGCGNGDLTAALRAGSRYIVHGLDTDPAAVAAARKRLSERGVYGPVSVARFDGRRLPYVGNTVSLVVAEDLGAVPMKEVLRILAPEGVACVRRGGEWTKTVKPRPGDIDEWTHFLHDAGNNSVAEDRQVASPRTLRWVAGPLHCRSHEFPTSVQSVVTTGGRIFTIFDEAPCGVFERLPQKCHLIARDAFNGALLWKVPLRKWDSKYGTGVGNRWGMHHTIARRLVAVDDRVYATLQFLESPVSVLDAATGKILVEALEGTKGTDEIVVDDGVLVAVVCADRSPGAQDQIRPKSLTNALVAVDVRTGKALWRKADAGAAPYTLALSGGRVVYHDLEEIVCLDARTGREHWRSPNRVPAVASGAVTLVVHDGRVLHHCRMGRQKKQLTVMALDDGRQLWQRDGFGPISAACTLPTEVFVMGDTVWCGTSTQGLDLATGKPKAEVNLYNLITPGHHRRCIRGKATVNYVIRNKRGAEFVDLDGDDHMRNDWLRTPCFTGATPANGVFYSPPDQCFCYPGVKVNGYMAMAADPVETVKPVSDAALEKGGAYGRADGPAAADEDWPMYRRDARRSGSTSTAVPAELKQAWAVTCAAPATQPVVVGDRLWIAEKDAHAVRCLDAESGKDVWRFVAGGRIDSSPTVQDGLVLFGCRDGCVYALRASDGELAWRFRAAPQERRLVAFEQPESVWPVHGSVLVQDGLVYFAAGRSSFLDGGIAVYALDAKTGRVRHTQVLEGPWPDIKTDVDRPFAMEGALPDVFVSDAEKNLYMMRVKFDPALERLTVERESPLGELDMGGMHLAATGGFINDTNFDRIYWMYSKRWPGFYFAQQSPKAGQLVVFDQATTYAVKFFYRRHQWSPKFFPGDQGYLLFADDNGNEPGFLKKTRKGEGPGLLEWLPEQSQKDSHRRGGRGVEKGTGYVRHAPAKWQTMIPVRVRAMLVAGDRLVVAGPPDVVPEDDPHAAFEGRAGAVLQVRSARDGTCLASQKLDAPPVFDGLSAAHGRLYMATRDGKVLCFGK